MDGFGSLCVVWLGLPVRGRGDCVGKGSLWGTSLRVRTRTRRERAKSAYAYGMVGAWDGEEVVFRAVDFRAVMAEMFVVLGWFVRTLLVVVRFVNPRREGSVRSVLPSPGIA
jgi:hypothetical protein